MKLVIREKDTWASHRLVPIGVDKVDDEQALILSHLKSGEQAVKITAERGTGRLMIECTNGANVAFTGDARPAEPPPPPAIVKGERCFTVADGVATFYNPETNAAVELEIATGGTHVPDFADEIYGQNPMLFAMALALKQGKHVMLTGPTGVGKTMIGRFLAKTLGWNFLLQSISRGTEDRHMLGEHLPTGRAEFTWTDGRITEAARLSQTHPTILVLDEINRIGNVQEFARIYSLLDDSKMLELPERAHETGAAEIVKAGNLVIIATANPVDDDGGDYIGVRELDPAFLSRFAIQPAIGYPDAKIEANALRRRVHGLNADTATKMVKIANAVRKSAEIRFPFGFRELVTWAEVLPFYSFEAAAEVAVITKAHPSFRADIRKFIDVS